MLTIPVQYRWVLAARTKRVGWLQVVERRGESCTDQRVNIIKLLRRPSRQILQPACKKKEARGQFPQTMAESQTKPPSRWTRSYNTRTGVPEHSRAKEKVLREQIFQYFRYSLRASCAAGSTCVQHIDGAKDCSRLTARAYFGGHGWDNESAAPRNTSS